MPQFSIVTGNSEARGSAVAVGSAVGATATGAEEAGGKACGFTLLQATTDIKTITELNFNNNDVINLPK